MYAVLLLVLRKLARKARLGVGAWIFFFFFLAVRGWDGRRWSIGVGIEDDGDAAIECNARDETKFENGDL